MKQVPDFAARLQKVKKRLKEQEIDAMLVSKKENQIYLSGFASSNCFLIITEDVNYLLTDFRYIEAAESKKPLFELVLTDRANTVFSFLNQLAPNRLGLEQEVVTLAFANELAEKTGLTKTFRADGLVEQVRAIKDQTELNGIREAASIADLGFSYLLDVIKPGISEREVALSLESFLRKNGAERLSFDTICVSGVRSSLPHGEPSDKLIEKGDFVTLDFGCVVDGYCSDMTRTVAVGTVTAEQRHVYDIVLNAQLAGLEAVRAGVSCREVDRISRDLITAAGYGREFGHGLGHGVGLEIHEAPTLNQSSEEILRENMLVTIEPGIYLPKKFGIRIEDLAIVTASGIINVVNSEKELIVL